ncbi:MAG: poly-beta-1,6-N-acetyl-D-glucosamine biosynthesis protein PgaD [Methylococcales bacterium]|nr:poly-beta-1,6-N-acetyl-D-glucosamine biosynthesis protein PgaD [Methylococcales bacterium]
MKDIIINQPHLQSVQQKCGSVFLSAISWLLWLYFLLPLFTLGGWLLGVKNLSDEIRWFGGYKTLLELLWLYGEIIALIAALWTLWTLCLFLLHTGAEPASNAPVDDRQLCAAFRVESASLSNARASRKITVHFDDHAIITAMDYDGEE